VGRTINNASIEERLARRERSRVARENMVDWCQLFECGCAFGLSSYGDQSTGRLIRVCKEHNYLLKSDWNGSEIYVDRIEPGRPKWHWGKGAVMPAVYMHPGREDV
jgi:hypothetical protein